VRQDWTDPDRGRTPTPEPLAAFVDGELDSGSSAWVESWLIDHPEMAVEAEAWRRLARVWAETAPPDPGPVAWARIRAGIEVALPSRPHSSTGGR
jgi:anti-sigma factor RsiW